MNRDTLVREASTSCRHKAHKSNQTHNPVQTTFIRTVLYIIQTHLFVLDVKTIHQKGHTIAEGTVVIAVKGVFDVGVLHGRCE